MSGIAGTFGFLDPALLVRMAEALQHSDRDDVGTAVLGQTGLAAVHFGLSGPELPGQPTASERRHMLLSFDGEIYNGRELRAELKKEGLVFQGHSDNEVVLRGFEKFGSAFIESLEGMFGLAITDGVRLWLARDSFGMKSLFYRLSEDAARLWFGSEVKALLQDPTMPRALDVHALFAFRVFGFPIEEHTFLEGIRQLPPGAVLEMSLNAENRIVSALSRLAPPRSPEVPSDEQESAAMLLHLLRNSVKRRMKAEQKIGVFLSGGVDSVLIAGLLPRSARRFSFVGTDQGDLADVEAAGMVAQALGTVHRVLTIDSQDLLRCLPDAISANECPMGPTLAFHAAPVIRDSVRSALCGQGADHLFGGLYASELLSRFRKNYDHATQAFQLPEAWIESCHALLSRWERDSYAVLYEELVNQADLWDRGSRAASLKVRFPFLDRRLRALSGVLPHDQMVWNGRRKSVLQHLLAQVLPPELAAYVADRKKVAARSALHHARRDLTRLTTDFVPAHHLETHPFRTFWTKQPPAFLYFDLFFFLFLAGDGRVPKGFRVDQLYGKYYELLTATIQLASTGLVPAKANKRNQRPFATEKWRK